MTERVPHAPLPGEHTVEPSSPAELLLRFQPDGFYLVTPGHGKPSKPGERDGRVGFLPDRVRAVSILVTVDPPEHHDPDELPAWSSPRPVTRLHLTDDEGAVLARITIPRGASEATIITRRASAQPHVTIALGGR